MQTDEDLLWLHKVRDFEFEAALDYFPKNSNLSILELGSGTGYIINKLRERYAVVSGLEVKGSAYEFFDKEITIYDGKNMPFEDESFDIIFSSHVLEHVPHINEYLEEAARILKPGGIAIHIMPSSLWRFLTSCMHYPALTKLIFTGAQKAKRQQIKTDTKNKSWTELIKFALIAPRHGEYGNVFTEHYYFSRFRWSKVFLKSSFSLVESRGAGLIYWGRDIFRLTWSIRSRQFLARIFGSASNIYLLRKPL